MPIQESRAGQLNAVIDGKLLFLAKVVARYKAQTLVEFIEDAFERALTTEAVLSDEPTPGNEFKPKPKTPLFFESLWNEDSRVRLFNVGLAGRELLAPKQRNIYDYVINTLIKQGKKVTPKNCVNFIELPKDEVSNDRARA
jgi:hypothetical protein